MPAPTSKAQARFFGAIAGGKVKRKGFTAKEARTRLRGTKFKNLPAYARRKKRR